MGACRTVLSFISSIPQTPLSLSLSLSLDAAAAASNLLHCTPLFPVAFKHFLGNHFLHHRLLSRHPSNRSP
ncbi:unnamed protein product, partial [Musa textilis]